MSELLAIKPSKSPWLAVREIFTRLGRRLSGFENIALSLVLGSMVILPLAEVVLRLFYMGIDAASSLIQHLTLAVASIGGAVAARNDKLLSFSASHLLKGKAGQMAKTFSYAFSTGICALLCIASIQFISVEMDGGSILAYGIPTWVFELVQPLGFGLITWRLLKHAAHEIEGYIVTVIIAVSISA